MVGISQRMQRRRNEVCVRKTFVDFSQNTSIHGMKYTTDEACSFWERVFWGTVICLVSLAAFYLTSLHLKRFASNPMRSRIITYHAPTNIIPFPAVTICNTNRIMESKIESFIKKLDLKGDDGDFLRRVFPQLIGIIRVAEYNTTEIQRMKDILDRNDYLYADLILRKLGQTCREMLIKCKWNGESMDCMRMFEESYTLDGLCCSFNYYGGSRFNFSPNYTIYTGWHSGLSVTIDPMLQGVQYSSSYASGVKVTIHNSLEYPGFETSSKLVSAGVSFFIQIAATKLINTKAVEFLSRDQRECVFTGERKLKYHSYYYFSSCMAELYSRYIYLACNCVPFYLTFSARPKCDISKIPCLQHFFIEHNAQNEMDSKCPARCENIVYRIYTAHTHINNITLVLSGKNKQKSLERSGIRLHVFFIGSHKLLSRDVYTSTLNLLSSIGGIYSLFMGCSIVTIFEIIYYCTLRFMFNLGWLRRTALIPKEKTHDSNKFQTKLMKNNVHVIKWDTNSDVPYLK